MPFSEKVKDDLYARSGGRCECTRLHGRSLGELFLTVPHVGGRCRNTFDRYGGQWHAHHVLAEANGGPSTLSNGEALCVPCHQLTASYGG